MSKVIFVITLLFMGSCTGIRDRNTYNIELIYLEEGLNRQGELVREYIRNTCCIGNEFHDSIDCHSALDTYITVKERTPYHLAMMRYLGRLAEDRPEVPEVVVEGAILCE